MRDRLKSRETHGDGTPILGRVEQHKRRGSPRKETRASPLIKASRVGIVEERDREVRVMRKADTILALIQERGKKGRKTMALCRTCHMDIQYGHPMRREPIRLKDIKALQKEATKLLL